MRASKVILGATTFLVASFTSLLTLLIGLSRVVNAPPGVESGFWGITLVSVVGLAGAALVFFKTRASTIALGLAAVMTIVFITPENGLPAALYTGSAVLALVTYFVDGRMVRTGAARGGL